MLARHGIAWPRIALTLPLVATAVTGCRGAQSMLDPAGPAATMIVDVWWWMAAGAVLVLGLVMALLWWALTHPRHRLADGRGVGLIIAGGIALPTVLLIVLLVYGTHIGKKAKTLDAHRPLLVEVEGRQWAWTFRYLDEAGRIARATTDRLVLPLGRTVEFRVTSTDVIHSFWIPRLGGKIDAIPGHVNILRLRADTAGPMRGQCAEFCGLRHAHMAFDVDVVAAPDFERWLAGGPATRPPRAPQATAAAEANTGGRP